MNIFFDDLDPGSCRADAHSTLPGMKYGLEMPVIPSPPLGCSPHRVEGTVGKRGGRWRRDCVRGTVPDAGFGMPPERTTGFSDKLRADSFVALFSDAAGTAAPLGNSSQHVHVVEGIRGKSFSDGKQCFEADQPGAHCVDAAASALQARCGGDASSTFSRDASLRGRASGDPSRETRAAPAAHKGALG